MNNLEKRINLKPNKPRICITSPDFTGPVRNGGVGTACFYQALNLSEAGHPVTVLFTGRAEEGCPEEWAETYRQKFGWIYIDLLAWADQNLPDNDRLGNYPPLPQLRVSRMLLEYLKHHAFDVVYFQDYIGHALFSLQYKRAGLGFENTAFCVTVHSFRQWILEGMRQFPASLMDFAAQQAEVEALRLADTLVAPSNYMADWASSRIGRSRADFDVVPYCFDKTRVMADAPMTATFGPFDHLVFFGRLETRKGLHLFLDALRTSAFIRSHIKKVTFLGRHASVLGMDSAQRIVSDMSQVPEFKWRIIDTFNTHQALDWLHSQRRTLVITPSLSDNLPLTIIELFVNRLPFVTTDVGGIPEIVGLENRLVMAAPNALSLRRIIEKILEDNQLTVSYAQGFDPIRSGRLHLEHLERLIGGQRPRRPLIEPINREPMVSVIIPHFNSPAYLEQALATLLTQDFTDSYEIIIVDDCSTEEGTWSQLERMTKRLDDSRLQLTRMTLNRGPAASRNYGVTIARGYYLVFFDADNEALPHMLATMVRAIQASGLDCMTCFNCVIKQHDRDNPRPLDPKNAGVIYTPIGPDLELGVFLNVYGDTCSIMRRDVPKEVGGWPEHRDSREDWEFFTKVCINGFGFGVIPEVLYLYRDDRDSRRNQKTEVQNYLGMNRIVSHLASPAGRQRIHLKDLLLFSVGMTSSAKPASHYTLSAVYNCFAKLNPEALATYLNLNTSAGPGLEFSQGKTIQRVQEVLWPLVRRWENCGEPRRVMLFGAGEHSKVLLGVMPLIGRYLKGFIDSGIRGTFIGLPCWGPTEVSAENVDVIVYSSAVHELAMYASLRHLPVEHVLLYHELPDGAAPISD